jgi:PDZ domain-containing protein
MQPARLVVGRDPTTARRVSLDLMASAARTARAVALRQLGSRAPADTTVEIQSGSIGGPSAGLAFALEIIDQLMPAGLTGHMRVAVTGTLDLGGRVGPVGGVRQKTMAARRAGAQLLIVPNPDYAEAAALAGNGMGVIGVGSLDDALRALNGMGRRGV